MAKPQSTKRSTRGSLQDTKVTPSKRARVTISAVKTEVEEYTPAAKDLSVLPADSIVQTDDSDGITISRKPVRPPSNSKVGFRIDTYL